MADNSQINIKSKNVKPAIDSFFKPTLRFCFEIGAFMAGSTIAYMGAVATVSSEHELVGFILFGLGVSIFGLLSVKEYFQGKADFAASLLEVKNGTKIITVQSRQALKEGKE